MVDDPGFETLRARGEKKREESRRREEEQEERNAEGKRKMDIAFAVRFSFSLFGQRII